MRFQKPDDQLSRAVKAARRRERESDRRADRNADQAVIDACLDNGGTLDEAHRLLASLPKVPKPW